MILILLIISPVSTLIAQKKLILSRIGSKNKIVYKAGDQLKLKTKATEYYVGGPIHRLSDSIVHFKEFSIHLDEIAEIDIRGKHMRAFNVGQYGPSLMIAGVGFLALDGLNQGAVDQSSLLPSSIMVATGYVLWLLREKKFKIKGRNKIAIID